jgi:hypothetical protein
VWSAVSALEPDNTSGGYEESRESNSASSTIQKPYTPVPFGSLDMNSRGVCSPEASRSYCCYLAMFIG